MIEKNGVLRPAKEMWKQAINHLWQAFLSLRTFERPCGVDAPPVACQRLGVQTPLVQHVSLRHVAEGSHKRIRYGKPETDL